MRWKKRERSNQKAQAAAQSNSERQRSIELQYRALHGWTTQSCFRVSHLVPVVVIVPSIVALVSLDG
jgi:hypothetical protein